MKCQVYPRALCRMICEGIAAEKTLRALGMKAIPLMSLDAIEQAAFTAGGELPEADGIYAFDDQSGEPLDLKLVRAARREKMAHFHGIKVYDRVE